MVADDAPLIGQVEVRNPPDGTPLLVDVTGGFPDPLPTQDAADGTPGTPPPALAIQVAGTDGTDLRALLTDNTGQLMVLVEDSVTVLQGTSPWVVSGTVAATQSGAWTVGVSGTVTVTGTVAATQSGAWTVAATQSGSWTVGITGSVTVTGTVTVDQGTTPWDVSQDAGSNPWVVSGTVAATQSGSWDVGVTGTVTVSGTVAATQSGPWTVAATQSGSWTVAVTGTVTVSGTVAATQSGSWTVAATQSGAWTVGVSGTVTVSGTVAATQSGVWTVAASQSGAWTVAATQSGAWTVAATQSGSWTVAVTLPVTATLPTGQAKIAVTGTAVQIDASSVALTQGMVITARQVNVGSLWIGGSGVQNGFNPGTNTGYELFPGCSFEIPANNADLLYMNGTAGDGLTWAGA